jgi:ATP-dependent DNA helicase RecG
MKIDLKELSTRESERVEWKENVADVDDVVRTMSAFANDISNLGGGYVVCGAKETRDEHGFQQVDLVGLDSKRFKEVENQALAHCRMNISPPLVPIIEEISMENGRRILVFLVPSTGHAHEYRSGSEKGGRYFIRVGRETREARNGLLTELLVRKGAKEPWDRRINPEASVGDIDLIGLRDGLRQMGLWDPQRPLEDYLSDKESLSNFVPPLMGRSGMDKEGHPRNFALLFFGAQPLRFISGAYAIFSIYRGKDRSEPTSERVEVVGSLGEQAKKLIDLLNIEAYVAFDKTGEQPNQVKYPRRALQEAVINAIAHRDYELDQPVRITVFSDRIEITSPGSLPRGIDPDRFRQGKATAHWRNQALAYFLSKLQLAQAEGQGIPTIIRVMQEEGCPPPSFEFTEENVTCILPAHPRHALMRELSMIENKIILGNHQEAVDKLESLLKVDPYNFRCIELYCEVSNLLGASGPSVRVASKWLD